MSIQLMNLCETNNCVLAAKLAATSTSELINLTSKPPTNTRILAAKVPSTNTIVLPLN